MTPFMKWLKKLQEKHLGTFAEGPEPPKRLSKSAELFARLHPKASISEWIEFAGAHAERSYQEGYIRGFERGERLGPEWEDPDEAAKLLEQMEEAVAAPGNDSFDPDAVVPIEGVPQEYAAKQMLEMANEYYASQPSHSGPRRRM